MTTSLTNQLRGLIAQCQEMDDQQAAIQADLAKLRHERDVLWEVAYEGLPRGKAFYNIVEARTGMTPEQAAAFFTPIGGNR